MAQARTTGLYQYLKWGTSAASAGLGLWTGGDLSTDPDARSREGVGGNEARTGGLCKFGGKADCYVSATNEALVGYGLRASYPRGALQELVFEGGADSWGRTYGTSVITEGSLDWSVGEALKYGFTWGALTIDDTAGSTMPAEANPVWEDYQFAVQFGGSEYGALSLSIKWTNGVTFHSDGDTKTSGQIRWPTYYLLGPEEVTVDLTTGLPLPTATLDTFADVLPTNLGLTLIASGGPSITLTNLQPTPESFAQKDNGAQVEWKYGFKGSRASGSVAWGFGA